MRLTWLSGLRMQSRKDSRSAEIQSRGVAPLAPSHSGGGVSVALPITMLNAVLLLRVCGGKDSD